MKAHRNIEYLEQLCPIEMRAIYVNLDFLVATVMKVESR